MPSYKLIYFDARGRGEIARMMFAAVDQAFEDKRVQFTDWPDLKKGMPQGTLPVLEIDGKKKISQSATIARYLARNLEYDTYIDADDILPNRPYIPTRQSRDSILDRNGRRLIELCQSTSYIIGNGRLHDDFGIGEFKYHSMNGSSVVDYFLLNIYDFDFVSGF